LKRQDARSLSENESVNMKKKIKTKKLSIIRDLGGEEASSQFSGKRERSKTFELDRPANNEKLRIKKGKTIVISNDNQSPSQIKKLKEDYKE
jgi:hypothetical protein